MNLDYKRLCRVCLTKINHSVELFPIDLEIISGFTIRTIIANSVEMALSERFGVLDQICEYCLKHFLVANKIKNKLFKAEEFFDNFPMTKKKNEDVNNKTAKDQKSKMDDDSKSKLKNPIEKVEKSCQTEENIPVEPNKVVSSSSQSKNFAQLSPVSSDEGQFIIVSDDNNSDLEIVNESGILKAIAMTQVKSTGGLSKNIERQVDENFDCKDCTRNFASKKDLQTHKELFHYEMLLRRCDICFREYTIKSKLKKHRKSKHPTCSICCRIFVSKSSFKRHQDIVHKDQTK